MRIASTLARICIGGAALLATLAGAALHAQAPDPYAELVAVLAPEDQMEADFRTRTASTLPADLRAEPELAALERDCPGAIDSMVAAIGPVLDDTGEAFRASYRMQFRALLAAELSPDQAREATAFYTSDLGMRMMAGRRALRQTDNTDRSIESSEAGTVGEAALLRDQLAAARAGQAAMSDEDRAALAATFRTTAWGRTITRLRPDITALQVRAYNEFMTANQPAMGAAMERGLEAHLLRCRP